MSDLDLKSSLLVPAINAATGMSTLIANLTTAPSQQAAAQEMTKAGAKSMMMLAITSAVMIQQLGPHIPMLAKATNEGIAAVGEVIKGIGEVVPF